ncbi:DUF4097 domain-containing protein [Microbacterium aurantiacum]|uniref:DUF4097 domain-containing protein n=1 Tax=Microbacterium aurantiacum TaxID=162393 RepID=UPI001F44E787|nr:DUF4097 domain-containing protein [Microbacterium aurantiacum]
MTTSTSRVIAILTAALGGAVVIGAVTTTAMSTVASASTSSSTQDVTVAGVDQIDLDLAAGDMRVEFTDVARAELRVDGGPDADRWTFERDGDVLRVASPSRGGPWNWGWGWNLEESSAVLTLPRELAGVDGAFDLAAGDLDVEGDFGALEISLGAGDARVDGSAREVEAEISAGRATLTLADVDDADLSVSAGALEGTFTGAAPRAVDIDVSAGSLELTLPDEAYRVTSDVSAGTVDNRLSTATDAARTVSVQLTAGQVVLRAE